MKEESEEENEREYRRACRHNKNWRRSNSEGGRAGEGVRGRGGGGGEGGRGGEGEGTGEEAGGERGGGGTRITIKEVKNQMRDEEERKGVN